MVSQSEKQRIDSLILCGMATPQDALAVGMEYARGIKTREASVNLRSWAPEEDYEVKQLSERRFAASFSNEKVDQGGDIIKASGWDLSVFKRNPIMLAFHDGYFPIGTIPRVGKAEVAGAPGLAGEIEFSPEGASHVADTLHALYQAKVIRAFSVGFKILEARQIKDEKERQKLGLGPFGVFSTKQRLFEISLVSIGMNSDALGKECDDLLTKGLVTKEGVESVIGRCDIDPIQVQEMVRDMCDQKTVVPVPSVTDNVPDYGPLIAGIESLNKTVEKFENSLESVVDLCSKQADVILALSDYAESAETDKPVSEELDLRGDELGKLLDELTEQIKEATGVQHASVGSARRGEGES